MQQQPSQRRAPSLLLQSSSRRDLGSLRAKLPNLDRRGELSNYLHLYVSFLYFLWILSICFSNSFDNDVPGMEELGGECDYYVYCEAVLCLNLMLGFVFLTLQTLQWSVPGRPLVTWSWATWLSLALSRPTSRHVWMFGTSLWFLM